MKHNKFKEIHTLVSAGISVLLTGEKGSGKTTLARQVAEELKLPFHCLSMTRQTTLSHLIGFRSVTGDYVPSQLREAVENGGIFLLDEIDAADANVLLSLNTIENGYISFPDGVIHLHEDFRLMATSNPQDEHEHYVGRNKLDAATLDRFDIIDIPVDSDLEKSLVDVDIYTYVSIARDSLAKANSSTRISMRDAMRFQKRKELNLHKGFMERKLTHSPVALEHYKAEAEKVVVFSDQSECQTYDDLIKLMKMQAGI